MRPQEDSELQVEYTLYTKQNPDKGDYLAPDPDSLRQSKFRGDRDTKFIIHGYTDQGSSDWVKNMAKEFLKYVRSAYCIYACHQRISQIFLRTA